MNWAHGGSEVPGLACRGPGASTDVLQALSLKYRQHSQGHTGEGSALHRRGGTCLSPLRQ